MRKIVTLLLLFAGAYAFPISANAEKQDVPLHPIGNEQKPKKPKAPLLCPVSGYIEDECLTLFCTSTDEAEIIIVDETGTIIYQESAVIYGEYCIFLEKEVNYCAIYITIGSHTFAGEL